MMTQKQIAEHFNLDQPTISRIKNGQRGRIGAFNALKISKASGKDLAEVAFMPMPELWLLLLETAGGNAKSKK